MSLVFFLLKYEILIGFVGNLIKILLVASEIPLSNAFKLRELKVMKCNFCLLTAFYNICNIVNKLYGRIVLDKMSHKICGQKVVKALEQIMNTKSSHKMAVKRPMFLLVNIKMFGMRYEIIKSRVF